MFSVFISSIRSIEILKHEELAFLNYMRESGNIFTGDEYHFRLGVYLTNKRYVQQHNAAGKTFKLGMGPLSHLTHSEYSALLSRSFHSSDETQLLTLKNVNPPEEWDWRDKGVVTPICNQGACAASWAFGTIAAEESQWAIQMEQLFVLSSQCLVDCVQLSFGCGGGWPSGTYKSIMKQFNGTFILDSDYPYAAKKGACKFNSMPKAAPIMTTYGTTTKYNETALALAVSLVGVATVSVDASRTSFQLYQSGIYYEPDCSTETMDLSAACVGYGTEGTTNYWIVKNCFGDKWGEKGYIRMIKDKGNNCAIATDVHIPQVK